MFEAINSCPVLRGLNNKELEEVFRSIHFNIRDFEKNQVIMQSGETCHSLMILIHGEVRGEMMSFSGKTVKIEDIEAPKPIAPAFLFGKNNVCPVNIITNKPSKILFIPKEEVIKLLQKNKVILTNYLNIISSRSQFLSGKIKFLSFKTLKEKIAHYIFELAGDKLKTVYTGKSQQELAELFGVARPSLARTIKEMEQEGLIETSRKQITILDKEKLAKLIH